MLAVVELAWPVLVPLTGMAGFLENPTTNMLGACFCFLFSPSTNPSAVGCVWDKFALHNSLYNHKHNNQVDTNGGSQDMKQMKCKMRVSQTKQRRHNDLFD